MKLLIKASGINGDISHEVIADDMKFNDVVELAAFENFNLELDIRDNIDVYVPRAKIRYTMIEINGGK